MAEFPKQIDEGPVMPGTRFASTVTIPLPIPVHPEFEPVTVYVVVTVGDTVMEEVLSPVFHMYWIAPLAVKVVASACANCWVIYRYGWVC